MQFRHHFSDRLFHPFNTRKSDKKRKLSHRRAGFEVLKNRQLLTVCVGIAVSDSQAVEGGQDYGVFQVSRDTADSSSLTIEFRMDGTAVYNTSSASSDYRLYNQSGSLISLYQTYDATIQAYVYTGSVTIPADQTSTTIEVRSINDALREPDETVTIRLTEYANSGCGCGCGCGCSCGCGTTGSVYEIDEERMRRRSRLPLKITTPGTSMWKHRTPQDARRRREKRLIRCHICSHDPIRRI